MFIEIICNDETKVNSVIVLDLGPSQINGTESGISELISVSKKSATPNTSIIFFSLTFQGRLFEKKILKIFLFFCF